MALQFQDEDEKQTFDFVNALAKKALDVPGERKPAGKAFEQAKSELKTAQESAQKKSEEDRLAAIRNANKLYGDATDKEKEAAAAGVEGAKKLIQEYRSLKGFTYGDILKAGGFDDELPKQEMSNSELLTRLSMAILPGLAGFALGKATGSANPYIMAAGGADAGVKSLEFLNELDREKRKVAEQRRLLKAKAQMQEADDERQMMREALLMPQRERLRAQELASQMQLMAAKESLGRAFEAQKALSPREQAALKQMELAAELEKAQIQKAGKGAPRASVAQDAIDRNYAQQYVEYNALGGYSSTQKGIQELEEAISELKKYEKDTFGVTGKWTAITPDLLSSKREEIRAKIEAAVQNTLKPILGSQFAMREGEQVLRRAFDPKQEESVNIDRATKELQRLKERAEAAEATKNYYEKYGTLRGYVAPSGAQPKQEAPSETKREAVSTFIPPTADLLKKLSPEEKRQYVQGDLNTQQKLLKKALGAK